MMKRGVAGLGLCTGLALSGGCGGDAPPEGSIRVSEADSAGITLVTISGEVSSLPVWTLSPKPVTEISGEAPPYLGSVGEVGLLSDGRIVVEDNMTDELRLFDSEGHVAGLIGGAGSGPGEFQNLTTLTILPGDTVVTYDRRLYRISVFDPTGELLQTMSLTREDGGMNTLAMDAWAFGSRRFLLHRLSPWDSTNAAPVPRRDQRDAVLFLLDSGGNVAGDPIRFEGGYSVEFDMGDAGSPFANQPFIEVGSGGVVYGSGVRYEVTYSSPELRPLRIVRWHGWGVALEEEVIQGIREEYEAGWAELRAQRPDLVEGLLGALFSPEVLPDTLPALGSAVLDDAGRLWVSRFKPSTESWSQEDSWHILREDGHPLARIQLPPDARLAAARGNRVALILRDSLDVEHLRVYRVVEGGGALTSQEQR